MRRKRSPKLTAPKPPSPIPWWRSSLAQHAAIALLGVVLGLSCPYWPEAVRPICTYAAQVLHTNAIPAGGPHP